MILDGKELSDRVKAEVKQQVDSFASTYGRPPCLHVVLAGSDPASQVYARNKSKAAKKVGIDSVTHTFPSDVPQHVLETLVKELNANDEVDAILVQLPLPAGLSEHAIVDLVDPTKDVDGLHPHNTGLLFGGREGIVPCTPQGCMRLIEESGVQLAGRFAVVVGRSNLVGKPVAQLLLQKHATVTMAHSRTQRLDDLCRQADVLVVAVGRAGLVKGDWIKPGAVVIDVGTNRVNAGYLVGDVDFESAAERASAITPVPGGVGPLTIAYLLQNTVLAANLSKKRSNKQS